MVLTRLSYGLLITFLCLTALKSGRDSNKLTPSQEAGKKIYSQGIGASEVKITARMSGVNVPATVMPCINCHNAKGTGNPEGGITPANITWQVLTKQYQVKRQDGSFRNPYDESSLRKAISIGTDPSGNTLHSSMPRYNMSREDMDHLIAYLKVIGKDFDNGISQTQIKLGFSLPDARESSKNKAVKDLVNAYVKEINSEGGIYNRKIIVDFMVDPENAVADHFALAGFSDTYDASHYSIPTLLSHSKNRTSHTVDHLFYLYPSLMAQNLSLAGYAKTLGLQQKEVPVILYENRPFLKEAALALKQRLIEMYGTSVVWTEIHDLNIKSVVDNATICSDQTLYFIGSHKTGHTLLTALDKLEKYPNVLLSGSLSSIDITKVPLPFKTKVYIGYPTWLSERSATGLQLYKSLQKKYHLSARWKLAQLDALSMLITIEESLKRAGQNVNKETFRSKLESLYEFSTGLMQPLTFAPNKHVGSAMTYVTHFNTKQNRMQLLTTVASNEK